MASKSASTVGMMEGAFFVSRTELLSWINGLLQTSLAKVEQCASGAVYCQIIDACHPNTVAMQKVNWMAKVDHEYIPNYKVLQAAFDRHNIERNIQVDQLIRAKYQDNLEFLQWFKHFFECRYSGQPYNAQERRKKRQRRRRSWQERRRRQEKRLRSANLRTHYRRQEGTIQGLQWRLISFI